MKQPGLFDMAMRQRKLIQTKDFLGEVNKCVSWEAFRPILDAALRRSDREKGGRPPFDAVLMFKILVLQALYNLSDEQAEYQILDRISFMRFLGLELKDDVPDARTIWRFREDLRQAGAVEKLFAGFNEMLAERGYAASGGQIVDATFVEAPRQRNSREENDQVKRGEVPKEWSAKQKAHKDTDARWTRKHGRNYFGYKNHVNVDRKHKLIRDYQVTDASVHDSREFDGLLDPTNDCRDTWADSAYRSAEQEQRLEEQGYASHIHERAYRNKPLTAEQKAANRERSRIRARAEHVFGHIQTAMNGCYVRTIGIRRARVKIGLEVIAYNLSRFTFLMRSRPATG